MARGPGRRPPSDSVDMQKRRHETRTQVISVPEGVELKSDREQLLWLQYTRARNAKDWRSIELLQVAELVKIQIEQEDYELTLVLEGTTYTNRWGEPKLHPLLAQVNKLRTQKLSIMRSMGLIIAPADGGEARGVNAGGDSGGDQGGKTPEGPKKPGLLAVA